MTATAAPSAAGRNADPITMEVVRNALSTATNRANNQAARTLLLSRARPFVRALTVGASKDAGAKVGAN